MLILDVTSRLLKIGVVATIFTASACVHRPVVAPLAIVPETGRAELRLTAAPSSAFGDMVAFGVGFSNGAARTYRVSGAYIYAVDLDGHQVAPLAVEEAARQAGGAAELVAGMEGAGGGALLGGLFGALPGAILGAAYGGRGAGSGAAVGAGVGLAIGALSGFLESRNATEHEITQQLQGLALRDQWLGPGMPASGFVFYPRGRYVGIRAFVVDEATQDVLEVAGGLIETKG